jgi:hypothetical protein
VKTLTEEQGLRGWVGAYRVQWGAPRALPSTSRGDMDKLLDLFSPHLQNWQVAVPASQHSGKNLTHQLHEPCIVSPRWMSGTIIAINRPALRDLELPFIFFIHSCESPLLFCGSCPTCSLFSYFSFPYSSPSYVHFLFSESNSVPWMTAKTPTPYWNLQMVVRTINISTFLVSCCIRFLGLLWCQWH